MPFITCLFLSNCPVNGQSLEEILTQHRDAIGREGLSDIRSLLFEVKEQTDHGEEKKYSIIKKRPEKIRIEGMWEGQNYISAYDGIRAWTIAPWTGVSIPQLMTEMEKEELMLDAHIDSPLLFEEGYDKKLDLIGEVSLVNDEFHVVRMTLPSEKWVDFFINKKTKLIHKYVRYYSNNVERIEKEVFFKDYTLQGGVNMPMAYEHRYDTMLVDVWVEEVVFGFGVPNSFFSKPE